MSEPSQARQNRRNRRKKRPAKDTETEATPAVQPGLPGGKYAPIASNDLPRLHEAVLTILGNTGLSDATPSMIDTVVKSGGKLGEDGRLRFPKSLVEDALAGFQKGFVLCGREAKHDLSVEGYRVYTGTGGAAPYILDPETGAYRESTLQDLYDAARLVDSLEHIHFFSRPLVARDMPTEQLLDINTTYASLAGTSKHVCVSATNAVNAKEIAELCFSLAGSQAAFVKRPFLSLLCNHVTSPLRLAEHGIDALEQGALLGVPVHSNVFGQIGASSPVTLAASVAQTWAEVLAGAIFAWLVNPQTKIIFGPRPMVVDLRTGGMSGGGGEQALCMAATAQLGRFYDLPCSSIAGATDSKIADAQSGYEKALTVSLAAHAGSNLITQAAGMHASLMAAAFESYVIDNDMLGSISSSLKEIDIAQAEFSTDAIDRVVNTEGHFLGESETYDRMKSDFVYPIIADRRSPEEWEADGAIDILLAGRKTAKQILNTYYPQYISPEQDERLRANFDIRLPKDKIKSSSTR